jgi:hypothetical protein
VAEFKFFDDDDGSDEVAEFKFLMMVMVVTDILNFL